MSYNAAQFDTFVDNVERTVLEQVKETKPDMVRSLYLDLPWSPGEGDTVTFNSIALSPFGARVAENEKYPAVNPVEGPELSKRQVQYGLRMNVTRRMAKFNRYTEAKFTAAALAKGLSDQLDLEMTYQIFQGANQVSMAVANQPSASIATADGLALASASHSFNGKTGSNIMTAAALSLPQFNLAIQQMTENTYDDYGRNIMPNPNTIVIGPDQFMLQKAAQLIGSSLTPEDANNSVNIYKGAGWKIIQLKHGLKVPNTGAIDTSFRYYWAIMDSEMVRGNFQLKVAEAPSPERTTPDNENVLATLAVTQFAAFAAIRPQGTIYNFSTAQPS